MRRPTGLDRSMAAVIGAVLLLSACSTSGSSPAAKQTSKTTVPAKADVVLGVDGDGPVATLDQRYSSYNIEMVTVTGGSFWAPYAADDAKANRPPIDLTSPRLRNLAKALGPAYIRVSGTWANEVYFDPEGKASDTPPEGFTGVLTGDQWKGVGAFADAVGGEITTSYPSTDGARDDNGAWLPTEAAKRIAFDHANDIPVVAAELFNESTLPVGFPAGYDATDFARDFDTFTKLVHDEAPEMKVVGPSSANDINPNVLPASIKSADMLKLMGSDLDVFSYHFYPKSSKRCGGTGGVDVGITPEFLGAIDPIQAFYTDLRDRYAPKAPIWLTETGQAQCGGDPWSSDFVDVIRLIDTFGTFATHDGNAVFHNTLVGSDYAYLSEDGFDPRPNYFAAVLWNQLMGPKVLRPVARATTGNSTTYAQCTAGTRSTGVTYAVVNSDAKATRTAAAASDGAVVYQLTGESLDSPDVQLNGAVMKVKADGTMPTPKGKKVSGPISLPPASVTFIVDPKPVPACALSPKS